MTVKQRILTAGVAAPPRTVVSGLIGAAAIAVLTWVGASIVVPIQPVPITLQTLFVLLAGSAVGRAYGTLGQALYIGAGALGIPVFAGGAAGLGILAGPTGGYLASFIVAPFVVAVLLGGSGSIVRQTLAFVAGTLVIFAAGVGHLALFYTHDLTLALRVGLLPFLPGAAFKIVAAVSIHRSYQSLSGQIRARRDC